MGASFEQLLADGDLGMARCSRNQEQKGGAHDADARRERATVDLTEEEATKAAVKEALRCVTLKRWGP